jgi:hypothetical protein
VDERAAARMNVGAFLPSANGVADLPIHHPSTCTYLCPARYTLDGSFLPRVLGTQRAARRMNVGPFLPSTIVSDLPINHPSTSTYLSTHFSSLSVQ